MSVISAVDVQRLLHDRATVREWSAGPAVVAADGAIVVNIYGNGGVIATLRGAQSRENADLIINMRNTLPEHIASFGHLMDRIRILERELAHLKSANPNNGNEGNHHGPTRPKPTPHLRRQRRPVPR